MRGSDLEKVAVLTTFRSLPSGYGLVPVVLSQLRTLAKHGYEPHFYTEESFARHPDREKVPEGVEVMPKVPMVHLFDYQPGRPEQKHDVEGKGEHHPKGNRTNFKRQVDYIYDGLEPYLKNYDVILTHDVIFQTWFLTHNGAIRKIADKHPNIRWVHWLHSGPSSRPQGVKYPHIFRYSDMTNSVWVSPNETMVDKFAEMYHIPRAYVKVVYHTLDPVKFFDMHPLSAKMIEEYNLYDPAVLVVWPTRIDHPEAKGMYEVLEIIGWMNKILKKDNIDNDAVILFLNSWSSNPKAKNTMEKLRKYGYDHGIPRGCVRFSSEMGKEWENGVPWRVVRDMLWVGNCFMSGSVTETFSLATWEAAITKNMLILNERLGVFKELAGDRAEYFEGVEDWGGVRTATNYHPSRDVYFEDMAKKYLARLGYVTYTCEHCGEMLGNIGAYKPLMQSRYALKHFTDDWIWENQIRLLITGEDWRD